MAIEKHWATKQPAKQDEVRDVLVQGVDWALARKREIGIGAAAVAAVAIAAGLFVYSRQQRENEAWDKLSLAEAYSYYGRAKEAQEAMTAAAAQTDSPAAAGLGALMEGELKQAQGAGADAVASFTRAADLAPAPLKPFALSEKTASLELAGKHSECAASAQTFLDSHSDHFLAPQVHEILARCQFAGGQPDAAKATWQKISLQYPDTPWAARATARLQTGSK